MKDEFVIINKTQLLKRIEELESACIELFNLVHDSEGRIEYKIRANDLYDVAQHKEIKSTPLIPVVGNAWDASLAFNHPAGFDSGINKQDYISNLKLDI